MILLVYSNVQSIKAIKSFLSRTKPDCRSRTDKLINMFNEPKKFSNYIFTNKQGIRKIQMEMLGGVAEYGRNNFTHSFPFILAVFELWKSSWFIYLKTQLLNTYLSQNRFIKLLSNSIYRRKLLRRNKTVIERHNIAWLTNWKDSMQL